MTKTSPHRCPEAASVQPPATINSFVHRVERCGPGRNALGAPRRANGVPQAGPCRALRALRSLPHFDPSFPGGGGSWLPSAPDYSIVESIELDTGAKRRNAVGWAGQPLGRSDTERGASERRRLVRPWIPSEVTDDHDKNGR